MLSVIVVLMSDLMILKETGSVFMKSKITQLTTVLFLMASTVALPTAANAHSHDLVRAGTFAFETG